MSRDGWTHPLRLNPIMVNGVPAAAQSGLKTNDGVNLYGRRPNNTSDFDII
jgi:hypothetical protein